jgi:hypothetical protein
MKPRGILESLGILACVVREIRRREQEQEREGKRRGEERKIDKLTSCIPTQCNSDQLSAVRNQLIYKKDSNLVDTISMYHPPHPPANFQLRLPYAYTTTWITPFNYITTRNIIDYKRPSSQ